MLLITGAAGFIGYHVAKQQLEQGKEVVGVDNLNDYYDVNLKKSRLAQLQQYPNFHFKGLDIAAREAMEQLFAQHDFHTVLNLAAQAGVRYSLKNPRAYVDANLVGFTNILEGCRHHGVKHLVYASTSSVYGANTQQPFSESHSTEHPLSLYAATKKANELMAHTYSHLYQLPTTGLRFFTVYGPWGRPDMALFLFTKAMLNNQPIPVFNHGKMTRDFTYIDDIVGGVARVLEKPAQPNRTWATHSPDPGSSSAPYRLYNIGNNDPIALLDYIRALENALGKKANMTLLPMQPGDVSSTHADITRLIDEFDYKPNTSVDSGVQHFVDWYLRYYIKQTTQECSS